MEPAFFGPSSSKTFRKKKPSLTYLILYMHVHVPTF